MAIQKALSLEESKEYDYRIQEVSGDRVWVSNSEQVALHLRQRLKFNLGEWAYDTTIGVPWFDLFEKPMQKNLTDSLLKKTILQTPGVTGLVSYESSFDYRERSFSVTFRYTDQYSDAVQEQEITI